VAGFGKEVAQQEQQAEVNKVNAAQVAATAPSVPAYSISHSEARAWVMAQKGAWSASLDGIWLHYADASLDPNMHGQGVESAIVGSVVENQYCW